MPIPPVVHLHSRDSSTKKLVREEFSAKERFGPPVEGRLDADLDVWSGVVPVSLVRGEPIPAYA